MNGVLTKDRQVIGEVATYRYIFEEDIKHKSKNVEFEKERMRVSDLTELKGK